MLPEEKWNQYGSPNAEIKGIVIHNTNTPQTAAEVYEWIKNDSLTSKGCHFLVDHKEVIQVMPTDRTAWSTGMGCDFGNMHCIAVEVVSNLNTDLYMQGQSRAIMLIESLMDEFNLTKKDIYFHRDFKPYVNCPAQILAIYKTKSAFLRLIKEREVECKNS